MGQRCLPCRCRWPEGLEPGARATVCVGAPPPLGGPQHMLVCCPNKPSRGVGPKLRPRAKKLSPWGMWVDPLGRGRSLPCQGSLDTRSLDGGWHCGFCWWLGDWPWGLMDGQRCGGGGGSPKFGKEALQVSGRQHSFSLQSFNNSTQYLLICGQSRITVAHSLHNPM